jgi:hypothetical protein
MKRFMICLAIGILASCALSADDKDKDAKSKDVKLVKIVHVETGKVLAVEGCSEELAAKIVLVKDEDKPSLLWKIETDGEHLKITNSKTGKVLDVEGDSREEGASIIQYDMKTEGIENQRWSWSGKDENKRLVSKSSSMAIEPNEEGKVAQKKLAESEKKQLWKVVDAKK